MTTTAQMLIGGISAMELYTPEREMGYIRRVLGRIDLDPASCEMANTVVQATRYYSLYEGGEDGLELDWDGRIFRNPPYARGLVSQFIHKLIVSYEAGFVEEAILLVRPCTDTRWCQELLAYPVCFYRGCIKFYTPYTSYKGRTFTKNTYDNHFGSSFHYFGPNLGRFVEVFSELGMVKC
jgi:ParB family chromosome partitioning protein